MKLSMPAILIALVALSGCGISEYSLELVEGLRNQIEHRKEGVEMAQRDLNTFLESDESIGFRGIAESEEWAARLDVGRTKAAAAEQLFMDEVQSLVDMNDSSNEYRLFDHQDRINALLAESSDESEFWRKRANELFETRENAETMRNTARGVVSEIQDKLGQAQTRAAAAKREFPEQATAIDQFMAPLSRLAQASSASLANLEREYQAHASGGRADYGMMATESAAIAQSQTQAIQGSATAEARFAELSRSYAKTLIDMRADYSLTIRRQSWDEMAESPALHNFDFVREVEGPTFEHLEAIPGSLATFQKGWFSDSLSLGASVDQARWDELKIDPKENWPDGDAHAELWVEKAEAKYFHKYHVVDNGEITETDFVPVDEDLFFANVENLGMDVEVKPYGAFEAEKLTQAAPPGMAFVGNPRYGRWENQGGGQVWTWIAPYLFYRTLFGSPHVYPRNEWSTWRSGYYRSRPYYGAAGAGAAMYGTRGSRTQTSPTLSGSRFARSGGFNRPSGSVRGAGPSSRGGGFGGSGK